MTNSPTPPDPAPVDLDLTDEMMDMDWKEYESKFVRTDARYARFHRLVDLENALCREQHAHHATLRRLNVTSLLLVIVAFLFFITNVLGVFK